MVTRVAGVPLVDLGWQHAQIETEVIAGINGVLDHRGFILGPEVEQFEREFAAYCGVAHALGVGNGTDALELALRALGIGRGDEVIVPANTFVATAEAVVRAGADVVLVDNDSDYLINVRDVADRITPRTRAIMAVHLYGQTAPVERLRAVARDDIAIIEDAAQAQGARRFGVRAGALGTIAGTSFYPGKNLGAYGDAGGVITDNKELADRVGRLRNHGGRARYEHVDLGVNSRMDSFQAVVLSAKLAHLDAWNADRRAAADYYQELLVDTEQVITPRTVAGNEHVFHLYVVRVADRDRVVEALNAEGIGAAVHYPAPIHRLGAFAELKNGAYPRAEHYANEMLSLPIYPGIERSQQEMVVEALIRAVRG